MKWLTDYGLAGACVLLTLNILLMVGRIFYSQHQNKTKLTETTVETLSSQMKELKAASEKIAAQTSEIPKIKVDLRRYYVAMRVLAGGNWATIRQEMMDEKPLESDTP